MTTQAPEAPASELPPEPTFMLRARDVGSDEALITYLTVAKARGGDPAHLAGVEQAILDFRAFPVSVAAGVEPEGSVPGSSLHDRIAQHDAIEAGKKVATDFENRVRKLRAGATLDPEATIEELEAAFPKSE